MNNEEVSEEKKESIPNFDEDTSKDVSKYHKENLSNCNVDIYADNGIIFEEEIRFASTKYTVTNDHHQSIINFGLAYLNNNCYNIIIDAYHDGIGDEEYNERLSGNRKENVLSLFETYKFHINTNDIKYNYKGYSTDDSQSYNKYIGNRVIVLKLVPKE